MRKNSEANGILQPFPRICNVHLILNIPYHQKDPAGDRDQRAKDKQSSGCPTRVNSKPYKEPAEPEDHPERARPKESPLPAEIEHPILKRAEDIF